MPLRDELRSPSDRMKHHGENNKVVWLLILLCTMGLLASVYSAVAGYPLGQEMVQFDVM